jgi:hypothetical protein
MTEKPQKADGFVPVYINSEDEKIYLEISRFNRKFLYQVSLPINISLASIANNGRFTVFAMSAVSDCVLFNVAAGEAAAFKN